MEITAVPAISGTKLDTKKTFLLTQNHYITVIVYTVQYIGVLFDLVVIQYRNFSLNKINSGMVQVCITNSLVKNTLHFKA